MTLAKDSILEPDLEVVLQTLKLDIFRTLNVLRVGKITSFDATRKTAEIQIVFRRVLPNGTIVQHPLLVDCPVVVLQGGGASLQLPIAVGDSCIVLFSDRNLDYWFKTGADGPPLDARCHDLSDGIALVGINPLTSAMVAISSTEARLISGDAKVAVLLDGSEASLIQGAAEVTAVSGKVRVKNGATDLLTLIEGLIDVLEALTSQDPVSGAIPLTAASIAALEAQKAVFQGLLST